MMMPPLTIASPPADPLDGLIALLGPLWLLAALWTVVRHRLLTRDALATAPHRGGSLGLHDVLITIGLFILGPSAASAYFYAGSEAPLSGGPMLQRMLLSQVGMIPAVAYIIWRADTALPLGVAGLGLHPRQLLPSLVRGFGAFLVIFPLANLCSAVVIGILWLAGHRPPTIAHETLREMVQLDPGSGRWWGLAISAVIVAPVLEELIFRGLIQTALVQSGAIANRWTAIAITAAAFAAIHGSVASPHALPALYILAVGIGWTYERWGSLWTAITLHAMWNVTNIAIAWWTTSARA